MPTVEHDTIRFLRLDRTFAAYRDDFLSATEAVLESGQVVGGAHVENFESAVLELVDRRFACAVPSGTDALRVAASSLGVDQDWDILVPAYTYIATAGALRFHTPNIRVVDVDDQYHMDADAAERMIDANRPTLVVPVGIFGNGLCTRALRKLGRDGVVILEDAAQSLGSSHDDGPGGGFGVASTLSFAPTKVVPCFGNMGMVVTDDSELAERLQRLRRHGKRTGGDAADTHGFNAMPNAVQAAQLTVMLGHHEARARRRDRIASSYLEAIEQARGIHRPPVREGTTHAWHKFVVRHAQRDALREWLNGEGIQCSIHYPLTIDREENIVAPGQAETENARRLSRESLTLPLYPELEDLEVERICRAIRAFDPTNVP